MTAEIHVVPRHACVVLVPVSTAVDPGCERSLRGLEELGYAVRRVHGYAAIDQARNELASAAIQDGFAATMWIDSDIVFDSHDVDRLRQANLSLICGLYPKKGRRELACHLLPDTQTVTFGTNGGFVNVKYAGAGFLYVHTDVYRSIRETCRLPCCNQRFGRSVTPYFLPMVAGSGADAWYLAEDYAFCQRAVDSGHAIMADTRIRLYHAGRYEYGWEDAGSTSRRYAKYDLHLATQGKSTLELVDRR